MAALAPQSLAFIDAVVAFTLSPQSALAAVLAVAAFMPVQPAWAGQSDAALATAALAPQSLVFIAAVVAFALSPQSALAVVATALSPQPAALAVVALPQPSPANAAVLRAVMARTVSRVEKRFMVSSSLCIGPHGRGTVDPGDGSISIPDNSSLQDHGPRGQPFFSRLACS